jgi:predicted N-acetyltransferase YhbS
MLLVPDKEVLEKMTNIRPATEEDIPSILDLYRELIISTSQVETSRSPSTDDYRKVFAEIRADPRHELLVAEDQGEVVGTVVLLIVPNLSHSATPWALVENLVVGHEYRRRGLGRLLLEYAVARAKEKGCYRIQLCSDKRREEAHRFYHSVGFEASAYGFRIYF